MRRRTVDKKGKPVAITPARCCGNCVYYNGMPYESFGNCKINKTIEVNGANETVNLAGVDETDECPSFSGDNNYKENNNR